MSNWTFPFGRPVTACPSVGTSRSGVLVLGAYPSALHIAWQPPTGRGIRAISVDVEPVPFWNGSDEVAQIEEWKKLVKWKLTWGTASPVGRLNGSSGIWVDDCVLAPIGVDRASVIISDCLDTYRASTGGKARLEDTYEPITKVLSLPKAILPPHPSENEIVEEAIRDHGNRLRSLMKTKGIKTVVTLGNAALRVVRELTAQDQLPARLKPDTSYGWQLQLTGEWSTLAVLPLAHPAAPKIYQERHRTWMRYRHAANHLGASST